MDDRHAKNALDLFNAVQDGDVEMVRACLAHHEGALPIDSHGRTPLHWAADAPYVPRDLRNDFGDSISARRLAIFRLLLEYVEQHALDQCGLADDTQFTTLAYTIGAPIDPEFDRKDVVTEREQRLALLLEYCRDHLDIHGSRLPETPLHIAIHKNNEAAVRLLIALGVDIEARDAVGLEAAEYIVEAKTDPTITAMLRTAYAKVNRTLPPARGIKNGRYSFDTKGLGPENFALSVTRRSTAHTALDKLLKARGFDAPAANERDAKNTAPAQPNGKPPRHRL